MGQNIIPSTFDWPLGQRPSPNHSVDYVCGNCGTMLLHAEDGLTHNLFILCTQCGAHNSTDAQAAASGDGAIIR
jgi:DNA-directed RNA polymerase subunit RPC12/RpoP